MKEHNILQKIFAFVQSKQSLLLVLLVCLFILQRTGLLFFGSSHISHPAFDETASGVLACDLINNQVRMPIFAYQYEIRSGDSLLEGLLLAPIFKLCGCSLFSLKLFCLISAFLSLLLWSSFIRKYNGKWAAIIFTTLFAFPPPMFARLNLFSTVASHHIINPLMAAQLIILFNIFKTGKKSGSLWLWAGFGLLAGFGTYMFYTYLIFNAFCILFLLFFRSSSASPLRIACFIGGFAAGFSPWAAFRLLYPPEGGGYLLFLLKNMTISAWGFIQSFFFSIPHSFGYNFPSRATGFISIGLSLYILFFVFIVLKNALGSYKSLRDSSLINKIDNLSPCLLQGIFFGVFPLFFMSCLTLSPMQMNPLEYWPSVGLFGNFACADIYRYRWVHSLFPFYFAIISVGTAAVFTNSSKKVLYKSIAIIGILFFTLAGIVKSVQLYSKNDFGKIFFYKGYNYDRLANRFILLNFVHDYQEAKTIALNYPDENKPEVYRCLGTRAILSAAGEHQLEQYLSEVPEHYLDDFIYGIVRAAQNMPENRFQPFRNFLERMYPDMFYKNWGFRYLAYKYFGLLLNQKKLFEEIPSAEKWFFKKFLKKFKREISKSDTGLLKEIDSIPKSHQHNVVKGLGMLVGAEMLFDPLSSPDYPLDSRFGKKLNSALQEAFYEGIGAGFAETLCRFWRRLLPPEDVRPDLYEKMLEIEWQRCHSLMSKMPTAVYPAIKEGFVAELKRRHLNPLIRNFIDEKFKKGRANTKNHYL